MPNHVTNTIWFNAEPEKVEKIRKFMKGESEFDFNKLVKYPKEFDRQDKKAAKAIADGKGVFAVKDGFNSGGYEWCIDNWGTKWNAYEIIWDGDSVEFQTAWATPEPIFEALKAKFPDVEFQVGYYDEDMYSSNRGTLNY